MQKVVAHAVGLMPPGCERLVVGHPLRLKAMSCTLGFCSADESGMDLILLFWNWNGHTRLDPNPKTARFMKRFLILLGIAVVSSVALLYFNYRKNRRAGKPLTALVFLLSAPRRLTETDVRAVVFKAIGVELLSDDKNATDWLVSLPADRIQPSIPKDAAQSFMGRAKGRTFLINSFGMPYVENPEKFAREIRDLRLRKAIAAHRAWLSVDLYGEAPTESGKSEIYAQLGKMLAGLAGPDCLAIYCPELGRCNEFTPSIVAELEFGNPPAIFEQPTHAPVVEVSAGDPRMTAAVAEARRRWPEFVEAFQKCTNPDKPFMIKARFTDGAHTEFMWVSVRNIEPEKIYGRLENTPAELSNVREGDEAVVPLNDLNDWLCEIDSKAEAGYTLKAIAEITDR